MPVLSSADMAEFRALDEELGMPDTYALIEDIATDDGEGGETTTESVIEAGPCDLTAGMRRPDEMAVASRVQATALYTITLPYATLAAPKHRLAIGGRTFEIIDVLRDGYFGVDARAVCQEIT
jgi:hypothetical protein